MPIPVDYFQPLSFQQANPFLSGLQSGQQIYSQGVQNRYLGPTLAQQLQQLQLANQKSQAVLPYAAPQAAANVGLTQAQTGETQARIPLEQAQTGLTNNQANLLGKETPYLVQKSLVDAYPDPIMSRGVQLQNAQRSGAVSPQYLAMLTGSGAQFPAGTNNSQNQAQQLPNTTTGTNFGANGMPFGNNPLQNYALFGSPISPLAMMRLQAMGKGMDTQATTGVTQWNDAQQEAGKTADIGTQTSQLLDQFQNAYDKSKYKGSVLGTYPSKGILTAFQNMAPEQAADNASQNIAALVAKLIAGGRVTNYEMQYVNNLKPNRTMDQATAQMSKDFLQQKAMRMQEEQEFLNTARQQGLDVQTAQTLWQKYNNQRPVYNFSQQKPNTQFQKSWSDYLTPQAIGAAQSGQNYVPLPSFSSKQDFQNWYKTISPSDQATVKTELGRQQ